jgi:putative ABC transport system permease protein
MTCFQLILHNIWYFRNSYLAVLAGVIISTAVLTGALVVGDSVRGSLIALTDARLGKARFALQSGDHFFRQELATDLTKKIHVTVTPVFQSTGLAINGEKDLHINRVEVAGIDGRFLKLWDMPLQAPLADHAILSKNLAERLNLKIGDNFLLKVQKQGKAPQNAPFVSEKSSSVSINLSVSGIADAAKMGRFSLKSNQTAPFTVFVSLEQLAILQGLAGSANLLLVPAVTSDFTVDSLEKSLQQLWQLQDAGLRMDELKAEGGYEIRTDRIFFDNVQKEAIQKTIPRVESFLTYLVNEISTGEESTPYSFVTAASDSFTGIKLKDNEIIINQWLADDLKVRAGDPLLLKYYIMGALRSLREDSTRFVIRLVLPMPDRRWDSTLMPDFPGMSDAGSCRDWQAGAPVNLDKIREKDEKYWNDFRGTPKAIISLAAGQKLWNNKFGNITAFRFKGGKTEIPAVSKRLMQQLKAGEAGLNFQPVYEQGKTAAQNSTDFGELFLSLSFFIIAAALLLTALLFGLHAQTRLAEAGILSALGFKKKKIIEILLTEVLLVSIAGGLIGVFTGVVYNRLMLFGLNTLWQDAVRTNALQVHFNATTLITGSLAGILTSVLVMLIMLIRNLRKPLSGSIKGAGIEAIQKNSKTALISLVVFVTAALSTLLLLFLATFMLKQNQSLLFLSAGGAMLVAGLSFLNFKLVRSINDKASKGTGFYSLVFKNAALKRTRTMAAIALLSLGTFSIIITGANRKSFYGSENDRNSGTGGFLFWGETTVPVLYDLNSEEGKKQFSLEDEPALQNLRFLQMHQLDGDDASCLNLNQVNQPVILGVDAGYFDRQHAFGFEELDPAVNHEHPWQQLNAELADGVVPAYGDQTVITWGLRKAVGDTLRYRDEKGNILRIKLMGGLASSIFQGNILISDSLFRKYYPSVSGTKTMLIEAPFNQKEKIVNRLGSLMQDYGILLTPASERLANFNSVTNTYLSVFMLLGGLGILIGTAGLGIVLLRNIRERQPEMALYLALGYTRRLVFRLVAAEYGFIFLSGSSIGLFSALIGILPVVISPLIPLPVVLLSILMAAITANGFLWIYFPVKVALKNNLVQSLRTE